jgi:hypothetical protein
VFVSKAMMASTKYEFTNDLLHFTGKFKSGQNIKSKPNDAPGKKKLLRAYTRAQIWNVKCSEFALKTHNPIRVTTMRFNIDMI